MKQEMFDRQDGNCTYCSQPLTLNVAEAARIDHDKIHSLENCELMHFACHDKFDGREPRKMNSGQHRLWTEVILYEDLLKARNAAENKLRGLGRRSYGDSRLVEYCQRDIDTYADLVDEQSKVLAKLCKEIRPDYPILDYILNIHGVGPGIGARIIGLIDITKAPNASSLWSYAGLAGSSVDRYTKGKAGGGNQKLRTALYLLGSQMIKQKTPHYVDLYYSKKEEYEQSDRLVRTREKGGTTVEIPWKETSKGHRHAAARRYMVKQFLADLWRVWRMSEGLDAPELYIMGKENHSKMVWPWERGWPTPEEIANNTK